MGSDKLTLSEMARLVAMKHGGPILNELSKRHPFVEALDSELGQELLKDVLAIISEKAGMVLDETATDVDRATFRAARLIAERWANRVATYERLLREAKTQVAKGA